MSYTQWFEKHSQKHKQIVEKLLKQNFSQKQIIQYFEYNNMVINESAFGPLYKDGKKCHNMQDLNCYFCACPNFRFCDDGIKNIDNKIQFSFCAINSKDGKQAIYGSKIHQNCSACKIPHHKKYIDENFEYKWKKIMRKCSL